MTRALRLGAALALVLAAAACSGDAEPPTVATAGGVSASASPGGDAVAAYVETQRQLAKCFREQGFDVPDPDAKGNIDLGPAMGGRKKTDPKVLGAWEACKEFSVPVPEELQERVEPVTPEQLANRRAYAKCMRDNGMPRWPDPRPDGSWPEDTQSGELTPQEQAANLAALQICDPVLDGRPPTTPNPNDVPKG
jgi:hypothetical protein